MRSPIQSTPVAVQKWLARARYLRWLDAVVAWLALFVAVRLGLGIGGGAVGPALVITGLIVALAAMLGPLRTRWRPASGLVGLRVSRALRPGDRAWYVRGDRADLVIVTARHRLRLSIAAPELGAAESLSVRRTRVLVVPAAPAL
jgi:hypothetical protein